MAELFLRGYRRQPPRGPLRWIFIAASFSGILSGVLSNFYLIPFGWRFTGSGYLFFLIAVYLPLVFLSLPAARRSSDNRIPFYDILFAVLAFAAALFCSIHSIDILTQGWEVRAPLPARCAALTLLLLIIEAARRSAGDSFAAFVLLFAAYPLFAEHMPLFLNGKSFPFWRVVSYHGMGPDSVIGIPMQVTGNLLLGFMVFAVALQHTGAANFFLEFAASILGSVRGGIAKISIVASAFMGSMSGSVISNIMTTGPLTIPSMKKSGYTPRFAAAVEACASSGGVLMPPIMGTTAFVMAQILGVPYLSIISASLLPSLLYFLCLYLQADAFAARHGIRGTLKQDLPRFRSVAASGWLYFAALAVLLYGVVFLYRESQAPWLATAALLAMVMLRKKTRLTVGEFGDFLVTAGDFLGRLTAILAACGLIIGSMTLTGTAHAFSSEILHFAGQNPVILLMLGAGASFILGMGMTITACYIFLAVVLAPALIAMGFDPLAVHLFIMYWAMASYITPPVAVGAFTAAELAGASPIKTGIQAMRLGAAKYLLPFFFVLNPALILHGSLPDILLSAGTCALGIACIAGALEGYLLWVGTIPLWARGLVLAAGLLLGFPAMWTDLGGGCLLGVGALCKIRFRRKSDAVRGNE